MFRILVPKVERAVIACGTKDAVDRVERDGINRKKFADIANVLGSLPMAFE